MRTSRRGRRKKEPNKSVDCRDTLSLRWSFFCLNSSLSSSPRTPSSLFAENLGERERARAGLSRWTVGSLHGGRLFLHWTAGIEQEARYAAAGLADMCVVFVPV